MFCQKCRKNTVFDLETGAALEHELMRADEDELRCGGCRRFLAGVIPTRAGKIRIPCPISKCKKNNTYGITPTDSLKVPVE